MSRRRSQNSIPMLCGFLSQQHCRRQCLNCGERGCGGWWAPWSNDATNDGLTLKRVLPGYQTGQTSYALYRFANMRRYEPSVVREKLRIPTFADSTHQNP